MTAVATDSHIMPIASAAWGGPDFTALVPSAFCRLAASLGGEPRMATQGKMMDSGGLSNLILDWGWVQLGVRLTDGHFPKWRDVVPEKFGPVFEADSAELSRAVRAMASLNTDSYDDPAVVLSVDEGRVTVRPWGREPEAGGVVVAADADGKAEQAFKSKFLLKILAVVDGRACVSLGENQNKAAKIEMAPGKGFGLGTDDWKCIIMPVVMG